MADAVYNVEVRQRGLRDVDRNIQRIDQSGKEAGRTFQQTGREAQGAEQDIRNIGRSQPALEGTSASARSLRDNLGGIAKVVGPAAAAIGIGALATQAIGAAREITELSRIAQVGAEDFQRLSRQAELTGGNAEDMADALREMQLRLAEAADLGSGPAVDALGLLDLKLADLEGRTADEKFALLRDRISEVEDPSRRLFAAEELLGGSSERLQGLIGLTADEYARLRGETDQMTVAQTENLESIEDARIALGDFTTLIQNTAINVIGDAASELLELAGALGIVDSALERSAARAGITNDDINRLADSLAGSGGLGDALAKVNPFVDSASEALEKKLEALLRTEAGVDAVQLALAGEDAQLRLLLGTLSLAEIRQQAHAEATEETATETEAAARSTRRYLDELSGLPRALATTETNALLASMGIATVKTELDKVVGDHDVNINVGFNIEETILNELANFFASQGDIESASSARGLYRAITRSAARQGVRGNLFGQRGPTGGATSASTSSGGTASTSSGGTASTGLTDEEKEALADARAEGQAERLATQLELEGERRDDFIAQWREAEQADRDLKHQDELAFYARELTDADRVFGQWQDKKTRDERAAEARKRTNELLDQVRQASLSVAERVGAARRSAVSGFIGGLSSDQLAGLADSGILRQTLQQVGDDAAARARASELQRLRDQLGPAAVLAVAQSAGKRASALTLDDFRRAGVPELAFGGLIPATSGGQLFIGGEGGRDEIVAPLGPEFEQMMTRAVAAALNQWRGLDGARMELVGLDEGVLEAANIGIETGALNIS